MKFKDLNIGQTFDFIADDDIISSFRLICVKLSTRIYKSIETNIKYQIGSINARVYHIGK